MFSWILNLAVLEINNVSWYNLFELLLVCSKQSQGKPSPTRLDTALKNESKLELTLISSFVGGKY